MTNLVNYLTRDQDEIEQCGIDQPRDEGRNCKFVFRLVPQQTITRNAYLAIISGPLTIEQRIV